ncbi:BamA/TamA family outer membrane protein [Yoonia sp.]|uniref:BamA/TamA family outer membrane protein n=1 Tax=Yoonia sp. TaxID=2212373 RepID=UPI0039757CD7
MLEKTRAPLALSCLLAFGLPMDASAQGGASPTVEFQGLFYVTEADIRARCQIQDNRLYSQADLFSINQCLRRSGLFASHTLEPKGDDLVISVTEMESRPGKIEFGVFYNTTEDVIGTLYAERYNLVNGFAAKAELTYSSQRGFAEAQVYKQSVFGENLGLGFNLGFEQTQLNDQLFDTQRSQAEVFVRYDSFDRIQLDLGVGVRALEVKNIRSGASPILQSDLGSESRPYVRLGLKYQLPPTDVLKVFETRFDGYAWNLGGSRLYELQASIGSKFALGASPYSVLVNADAGVVFTQGDSATRIVDRFSLSPSQLRGFAARGTGPRDGSQFLGGNRYATARVELQRDFNEIFAVPLTAGLFANIGSVWGLEDNLITGTLVDDTARWRTSAGITLSTKIGNVPISMYVAAPIKRVPGDETQTFGINISTSF